MPRVQALYDAYHARGYEALAIDLGESNETVKPIARNYSFTFLRDSNLAVWDIYKMDQGYTPLNYVIDTVGIVVNSMELFDEDTIRSWVEPYLAGVSETPTVQPVELSALGSNPAVGHNSVRFSLPEAANVVLRVYSASGALVRTLCNGRLPAGANTVNWDLRDNSGRSVGNGPYLYELHAGSRVAHAKVLVLN